MKYLILAALLVAAPLPAMADGNGNFSIQAPPDWTPTLDGDQPVIDVNVWYTENGVVITEGVLIGPLQPGELRPLDATVFFGTGRTITANAYAEHTGQPDTRVSAVPVDNTFPLVAIVPPTLFAPPAAP